MIKLNDLAIGYNGEAILEHIDQEFDDGLIYGILAKSGAGKTTLLKQQQRSDYRRAECCGLYHQPYRVSIW